MFFFEKKNQKTFATLARSRKQLRDQFAKVFCFFSSEKKTFLLHATIHFTGAGTFSGADYINVMSGILGSMAEFRVTPLDCAGDGERLYIFWRASALIAGATRTWVGVDRMHIVNGMAIEEHVIFDSAVLHPPK